MLLHCLRQIKKIIINKLILFLINQGFIENPEHNKYYFIRKNSFIRDFNIDTATFFHFHKYIS